MNATATATAPIRGTAKTLRKAGLDLTQPVEFWGFEAKSPNATSIRYVSLVCTWKGLEGMHADGRSDWLGGVATRIWLSQATPVQQESTPAAPAPAAPAPAVEAVEPAPAMEAEVPAPAAEADDSDLEAMTFSQVMRLAKLHKVPGRGVARIGALREGVRVARQAPGARDLELVLTER